MMARLTTREREILSLIVKEFSSCEIAGQLELSIRTVETHRKNIYQKTSTRTLVGLMKYAIREGFIEGYHHSPVNELTPLRVLQHVG